MNDVCITVGVDGVFANPLDLAYSNISTNISTVEGSIDNNFIGIEHRLKRAEQRFERIEQLLKIIDRDINMEKKYPELARIADEYNATLEKYKTWDNLNDDYNQRTRQR